jgi:hypothetical protein
MARQHRASGGHVRRINALVCCEVEQETFVTDQMVEDAGEEAGSAGSSAEVLRLNSRDREEAAEPLGISREEGKRRNCKYFRFVGRGLSAPASH